MFQSLVVMDGGEYAECGDGAILTGLLVMPLTEDSAGMAICGEDIGWRGRVAAP